MALRIRPYSRDLLPAVALFNARLQKAGISPELRLPLDCVDFSKNQTTEERYLAVENEIVRGGYILRYDPYWVNNELRQLGFLRLPLSEGIVNKSLVPVGAYILRAASNTLTPLFALGMGGLENPFPKMLRALGWTIFLVPFYCRVQSPARVLKSIRCTSMTFVWRTPSDIAAHSGLGWVVCRTLQWLGERRERDVEAEQVHHFGVWTDETWLQSRKQCSLIGLRDAATLNQLYPSDGKFLKLRIAQRGFVGWAVVLDTKMTNHKQFGNLRVGTIVDCLSRPGRERAIIQGATEFLERQGVDLVISNQSHVTWREALRKSGFFRGPSNFAFAASPNLARIIFTQAARDLLHLNRGNGDGPIHLK